MAVIITTIKSQVAFSLSLPHKAVEVQVLGLRMATKATTTSYLTHYLPLLKMALKPDRVLTPTKLKAYLMECLMEFKDRVEPLTAQK